jgi:hypothetical protein
LALVVRLVQQVTTHATEMLLQVAVAHLLAQESLALVAVAVQAQMHHQVQVEQIIGEHLAVLHLQQTQQPMEIMEVVAVVVAEQM